MSYSIGVSEVGIDHSDYVAYGMQIELNEAMPWWDFNEIRPQGGKVMPMMAGKYDGAHNFLAIRSTWKRIEPGDPRFIGPYRGSDEPYLTWDGLLVAAAEEMKLAIISQPAWIFAPNDS